MNYPAGRAQDTAKTQILVDAQVKPQGVVLAFDDPAQAKELLARGQGQFTVALARSLADGVARRASAL